MTPPPAARAKVLAAAFASLLSARAAGPLPARSQDAEAFERTEATWRSALGAKILGAPSAQAGTVAAVCDDRSLRLLGTSGTPLWRYEAGRRLLPFLARSREGASYACDADGNLHAVNRAGRLLWKRRLDAPLAAPVSVGRDGRLFVATAKSVSCYAASGSRLWRRPLPAPPATGLVPTPDGGAAIALDGGAVQTFGPFGSATALSAPGRVMAIAPLGKGEAAAALADGSVVALSASDPPRKLAALKAPALALAVRGDGLFCACADGSVAFLDLGTGKARFEGRHAGPCAAAEAFSDERGLYVLTDAGAAGFAEDGRRLWVLRINRASALPAFSADGFVFSGGLDWILYAYRVEQRVRTGADSVLGPRSDRSYGLLGGRASPWADDPFGLEEWSVARTLDEIETAVDSGEVGEAEPDYCAYLVEIAGAALAAPVGRERSPAAVLVPQRVRALALVARFGSPELIPFLARAMDRDPDPLVRASAAEALGAIGVDPDGAAMAAFEAALSAPRAERDERVLLSLCAGIGALCRFSGPPLSETGVRLLAALGTPDRPAAVKAAAAREIRSISDRI